MIDGYAFETPKLDPTTNPDKLSDVRIGFDARLLPEGRIVLSVELFKHHAF